MMWLVGDFRAHLAECEATEAMVQNRKTVEFSLHDRTGVSLYHKWRSSSIWKFCSHVTVGCSRRWAQALSSNESTGPGCHGEERAELKGKVLNLLVDLYSNTYLVSRGVDRD